MLAYVTIFGSCFETNDKTEFHAIIKGKTLKEFDNKITICTNYVNDNLAKVYDNNSKTISSARFCKDEKDLQDLLDCCEQIGFFNGATLKNNLLKISYKVSDYGTVKDSKVNGNFKRILTNQLELNF